MLRGVRAGRCTCAAGGSAKPQRARGSSRAARPSTTRRALASPTLEPSRASPTEQKPLRLRIDGQWYDVRGWAQAHPGGKHWIEWMNGRDATGVFYALHSVGANGSDLAVRRLEKLPRCDPPPSAEMDLPSARDYATLQGFQELRAQLETDGWFERNPLQEAWALAQVLGLYAVGTAIAHDQPVLATLALGVGMQQAGWLAHDYIHGRGKWCEFMRPMGALLNGHSADWWMQKHSQHHCFTNEEGLDRDITMEPFFFLRSPKESGRADSPLRPFQHIYGYPLLSIMFLLWRYHSINHVVERKDKFEAACLAANYAWLLFALPLPVAVGSVFVSGFLVGSLVSATHQSEEIVPMDSNGAGPDFVEGQFASTRDADAVFGGPEAWLWGGMDTQLEHHLFPTMPRYKYHKLRPILQEWAKAKGVNYRISPSTKILSDNLETLRRVAAD
mmetsp:Transcript_12165/g.40016  ORF Transcript_12165/g.40016 Transcript_12165/m.40016 type:complete len:445 (+) Transcript_12165:23-1357(+)|eukprot:CAMPEP_0170144702 /NCGR_PEP_ID=MMETSP0033_2-20121228/15425_1 /TAXON_ID=195969 /ORGANISM="Dolichomastix tenuilepis, Strain CCMP3274" /LENGTH=444 /DNA_ID=CAMNT_0010381223 /DNA_START=23 /DNA_END=1357 /DNA_ORIENTATION=-